MKRPVSYNRRSKWVLGFCRGCFVSGGARLKSFHFECGDVVFDYHKIHENFSPDNERKIHYNSVIWYEICPFKFSVWGWKPQISDFVFTFIHIQSKIDFMGCVMISCFLGTKIIALFNELFWTQIEQIKTTQTMQHTWEAENLPWYNISFCFLPKLRKQFATLKFRTRWYFGK